jgi:hypothetical protein
VIRVPRLWAVDGAVTDVSLMLQITGLGSSIELATWLRRGFQPNLRMRFEGHGSNLQ